MEAKPLNANATSELNRNTLINIQAFRITKKQPSTDNRKREFVHMQQENTLIFGQINKKHIMGKHTIQHWVTTSSEQGLDSRTPYKIIKRCNGCSLNDRRDNRENHRCYFNKNCLKLTCINRTRNYCNNPDAKIIIDILETSNS
ncbi:hypothetical protein RclHR1_17730003 [Rhizophagus clarus]|uniref:Uncharacterized protein n=1 Tax=Rhizophagus clarus TaxID=94130 RepID=A0A2Z6RDH9_9GLOM|nr:hypothetical protein RclHR1_17730003 [Rhizophagus clarus]